MKNVTNPKVINIKFVKWIIDFTADVKAETGEEVTNISFKEKEDSIRGNTYKFKFVKGYMNFTPWTSTISAYTTEKKATFEGEEVTVIKVYHVKDGEFVVARKRISN
tara:strand:+ start:437 stop:757 length:321 start_codon:yes stop_codon:yes gene_type:complete